MRHNTEYASELAEETESELTASAEQRVRLRKRFLDGLAGVQQVLSESREGQGSQAGWATPYSAAKHM